MALWNRRHLDEILKIWISIDRIETEVFIELMVLIGAAFKAQYRPTCELWSAMGSQPVFQAIMSEQCFKQIKGSLRFDDP